MNVKEDGSLFLLVGKLICNKLFRRLRLLFVTYEMQLGAASSPRRRVQTLGCVTIEETLMKEYVP